jgi:hypothetical protein
VGCDIFRINCCHHFHDFFSGFSWNGHFSLDVEMVQSIGFPCVSESPVVAGCSRVVPFMSDMSAMQVTWSHVRHALMSWSCCVVNLCFIAIAMMAWSRCRRSSGLWMCGVVIVVLV